MSDHCQYLAFPGDGGNPRVVEHHPYPDTVSDDLDGALAEPIYLRNGRTVMWVRETAATEGHDRNLTASVIATLLGDWSRPVLILGPAVLTSVRAAGRLPDGVLMLQAEGFTSITAEGLARVASDVRLAIEGSDGPFETEGLDGSWPEQVRRYADKIRECVIADNWPMSESEDPADHDPICRLLGRAFEGRRFGLVPLGPGSFPPQ